MLDWNAIAQGGTAGIITIGLLNGISKLIASINNKNNTPPNIEDIVKRALESQKQQSTNGYVRVSTCEAVQKGFAGLLEANHNAIMIHLTDIKKALKNN